MVQSPARRSSAFSSHAARWLHILYNMSNTAGLSVPGTQIFQAQLMMVEKGASFAWPSAYIASCHFFVKYCRDDEQHYHYPPSSRLPLPAGGWTENTPSSSSSPSFSSSPCDERGSEWKDALGFPVASGSFLSLHSASALF